MNNEPEDSRGGLCLATLVIAAAVLTIATGGGIWIALLLK